MAGKGTLTIKIAGDDSGLKKALGSASGAVGKFGKFAGAAAIGGVAALGAAAFAVGTFALKGAMEIDKAMDIIRAGTAATGDDLAKLGTSFENVWKTVPASAEDVGTAIADLNTRTGLQGAALEELATAELQLTKITGSELNAVIAGSTRMFGDWSIATEDQVGSLDTLFNISQITGAEVGGLMETLVAYGAPLRQFGYDWETAALMLAKWEKEGVNTQLVLGGLKIALGKISKEGKDPRKELERTIETISSAGTTAEANAAAIELFGQRAGPDMAAAIREGRFDLEMLQEMLEANKDTLDSASQDTYSFGERWKMVSNQLKIALQPVGDIMMSALEKAAAAVEEHMPEIEKGVQDAVDWVVEKWPAIKETAKDVWEGAKKYAGMFWGWLQNHKGEIIEGINAIKTAASNFANYVVNHWPQISGTMQAVWDVAKVPLKLMHAQLKAQYEITKLAVEALEALGLIDIAPKVNMHNAGSIGKPQPYGPTQGSSPKVPAGYTPPTSSTGSRRAMAAGGIVTSATDITAGEAGAEAIIPLSQFPSLAADALARANGGRGAVVNLHIHAGTIVTETGLQRLIADTLRDLQRTSGVSFG